MRCASRDRARSRGGFVCQRRQRAEKFLNRAELESPLEGEKLLEIWKVSAGAQRGHGPWWESGVRRQVAHRQVGFLAKVIQATAEGLREIPRRLIGPTMMVRSQVRPLSQLVSG